MQKHNLEKIIVSSGLGKLNAQASFKDKILPQITEDLTNITGQKPVVRLAKKSISGFKIREGDVSGLQVTLRGQRMNDFLKKFVETTLPRIRDFRGIDPKSIDAQGNLTIGIREHIVFPEVNQDEVHRDFGLEITLVSNIKKNREESYEFFKGIGVPLKDMEVGKKKK